MRIPAIWPDPPHTFINSPKICRDARDAKRTRGYLAGQITGVEGYVESVATGWLAGLECVGCCGISYGAPRHSPIGRCAVRITLRQQNFRRNITFGRLPLPEETA